MYYSGINKCSVSEAPGISVVLFVSGCLPNKCREGNCIGCHNKDAQQFTYGTKYTTETKDEIVAAVEQSYVKAFVLCGGEPYDQDKAVLIDLVSTIKERMPEKKIWCYTGYEFDQIRNEELTKYLDVAVTGRFIIDLRDISDNNRWRGSTNQRVVLVKESLESGLIIYDPDIPNNN